MPRITSTKDLSQVNKQVGITDALQKQIDVLTERFKRVNTMVDDISSTHIPSFLNTIVFTWTGATGTISWPAGSIINKGNINQPVTAGSIPGLLPNTYYWLAWNPRLLQMVVKVGVDQLLQIKGNTVICQVYTGTAGQTGIVGGGGSSSSGSDLTGARYKLF